MRTIAIRLGILLASLAALCSVADTIIPIGTDTGYATLPLNSSKAQSRFTTLVYASEMSGACAINSLALDVHTKPTGPLNDWTIRIKHTSRTGYYSGDFESAGWTVVYQNDETIATTGWTTFSFTTPFNYDGESNLLVDMSFNNSSPGGSGGYCQTAGSNAPPRGLYAVADGTAPSPLVWSSNVGPLPSPNLVYPVLRLGVGAPIEEGTTDVTIGAGTSGWQYPMDTYHRKSRTQVIYRSSEIGESGRITYLSLNVKTVPSMDLGNWTIRMKHTDLSYYPSYNLESDGWTTVYQQTMRPSKTGWCEFPLSVPFDYDSSKNLMVDFSLNSSGISAPGSCYATAMPSMRSCYAYSDSLSDNPLDWSGTDPPSRSDSPWVPNVKLAFSLGAEGSPVILFEDEFPSLTLNKTNWPEQTGLNELVTDRVVEGNALHLFYSATISSISSKVMDLSSYDSAELRFSYRPFAVLYMEPGDTLLLEYWTGATWATLWSGDGSQMINAFVDKVVPISGAQLHDSFRFRFTSNCMGAEESFYLDNVSLIATPRAQQMPTITWLDPSAITYGTALSSTQLCATANTAGTFVYDPPLNEVPHAGIHTLSVTFTPNDTGSWASTTDDVSLTVNKRTLVAQAVSVSRVYGEANPAFTIGYSNFANGETASVLKFLPTAWTTATPTSPPGTYTITVSGGSDEDYAFYYLNGTLTVTPAPAVTLTDVSPHIAKDTESSFESSLTGTGFATGTTVKLVRTGEEGIDATTVSVVSDTQINCTFDVTGAATGLWDVVVTNGGNSATLAGSFAVTSSATASVTIGSGTATSFLPMFTEWHQSRTQVIYLGSEIGTSGDITALGLDVQTVPCPMTRWTIRIKPTDLDSYSSPSFETEGWTTVYQANEPVGANGWRMFTFDTPFPYDGTSNLLVDFSFNNSAVSMRSGDCSETSTGTVTRMAFGYSKSTAGDPLDWSGSGPSPFADGSWHIPNLRLLFNGDPAPTFSSIAPATGVNVGVVADANLVGTGFAENATVRLTKPGRNDIDATSLSVVSPTQITCAFDLTGAVAGDWDVVVTNPDFQAATLIGGFTVTNPAPTVTSITPDTGANDDTVSISSMVGTGFVDGATVELSKDGEANILGSSVQVGSATEITCVFDLTGVAVGDWDVVVTNPGSLPAVLAGGFTVTAGVPVPTVTGITPNKGGNTGPVAATLVGTQFLTDASVRLSMDGKADIAATDIVVVSPTEITCTFDLTGAAYGAWDVVVNNPGGKPGTLSGGFEVALPEGSVEVELSIGTGADTWAYPMTTSRHDTRTQVIYLADDLGTPGQITSLSLNVDTPPGQDMNNWTIRMKHTTAESYTGNGFETTDWTTVYHANEPVGTTGWRTFNFSSPFAYDGVSNLVVDFSFDNDSKSSTTGRCVATRVPFARCVMASSDSEDGSPLDWSSTVPSTRFIGVYYPNIKLGLVTSNPAPTIESISPETGSDTGTVGIAELVGTGFLRWTDVRLVRAGQPEIPALGVTVHSDTHISCHFDLRGAEAGTWDVVVTNVDGKSDTLVDGFAVVSAGTETASQITACDGATTLWVPLYTPYPDNRTQSIYLASEIGRAGQIRALSLHVETPPTHALKNWTIRMRYTDLDAYTKINFESAGWVTVYEADEDITATGWHTFVFDTPFDYDGIHNLMIDFSLYQTTTGAGGRCYALDTGALRTSYASASGEFGSPTTWSGTPAGNYSTIRLVPGIRLDITTDLPAPEVAGITPDTGVAAGSVAITNLAGTGFASGASVRLTRSGQADIVSDDVDVVSATQIICSLDIDGAQAGDWDVVVTNLDGQSDTLSAGFAIIPAPPAPTGITPDTGSNDGTVSITSLVGTGFMEDATVELAKAGESPIPAPDVVVESATLITCSFDLVGAATGDWDVVVTNGDGQSGTVAGGFTVTDPAPTLVAIDPREGVNDGVVTIKNLSGANFQADASVRLTKSGEDDIVGTGVSVTSPHLIACVFDLDGVATGSWDVVVTNPDNQSALLPAGFNVLPSPTVWFRDGFPGDALDGSKWLEAVDAAVSADAAYSSPYSVALSDGGAPVLRSRVIDLGGCHHAALSFQIRSSSDDLDQDLDVLAIEYLDAGGSMQGLGSTSTLGYTHTTSFTTLSIMLPEEALHDGFYLQFTPSLQAPASCFYLDDIEVFTSMVPSISWENPANITYGTALSATQLNATANTSGTFTYDPSDPAVLHAGTHTLTVHFEPDDAENWVSTYAEVELTVVKAALSASPVAASRVYGDGNPTFSISYEGFVGSDDASVVDTPPVAATSATSASPVGTYDITLSGGEDDDYEISYGTGSLEVTAKQLTVSGAAADDKTYDGTTEATISGATLNGVVDGDTVTIGSSVGAFERETVGAGIAVTASLSLAGDDAGNYTVAQPSGLTAEIFAKELTVSGASADDKTYDGTDVATISGATLDGIVDDEDVSLDSLAGTFSQETVGEGIGVTAALTLKGTRATNYTLTQPNGLAADIFAKELTVSGALADDKVYDGADAATISGATLLGIVGEDDVSLDSLAGTFSRSTVGEGIDVTAALTLTGTRAANYALTQPTDLTADITAKLVTVTADDTTRLVGEDNPAFSCTPEGLVGADTLGSVGLDVDCDCGADAASAPGDYAIKPSGDELFGNYQFQYIDGTLTVWPGIEVLGAGDAEIVLADSTPSTDDGTDLGDGTVGAPGIVQTFTIRSASDRDLTVSGIGITGAEAAEFSVGGIALPATIPAGGTTTFTVTFEPVGGGTRSAGVGIQSSVAARSPFTFSIQGTGTRIPVATADGWAMLQGTTLAVPAPGVLANDTDADGDQLTAVKVSDPAHGSLTLNADGSFSYTPTPDYIGSDSFTYKAEDGSHESNVATVSILVQQAHPVTFVLGTHGTRTGGGELEQVVVHGGAAEAPLFDIEPGWAFVRWSTSFASVKLTLTVTALYAPAYSLTVENGTGSGYYMTGYLVEDIAADAIPPGMKFAGWSVDPLMYGLNLGSRIAESTTFSMPSSAVTLTANYAYLDPVWEHELSVAGTTTWSLSFGMHLAATDGVDDDLDITHEDHGDEDGFLSSDDGQDLYSTEFRGQSESADYLLVLKAQDGVPVTASWAAPTLPEGKKLTIYEVVLSGGGVDRSAYTRTLVGYTAMDMSQAGSVTVPAGETRAYVLRYGDDVVYDLPFAAGWNLVSLPIEPTDPTTGTVLAGDDSRGGVIHTGSVWRWEDGGYVAATEMHACVGYWVYVEDATALLVQGQTVNQGPLVLSAGLNLCGTAVASDLPEDAGIGVVWLWQAACMRYCTVTTLLPGRGYWITAPAPVVLTLPGQ